MDFLSEPVQEASALNRDIATSDYQSLARITLERKQIIGSNCYIGRESWVLPGSATNCNDEVFGSDLILGPCIRCLCKRILVIELHRLIVDKGGFGVDVIDAELAHLRDVPEVDLFDVALNTVPQRHPIVLHRIVLTS